MSSYSLPRNHQVGDEVRVVGRPFTMSQRQTLWVVVETFVTCSWIARKEDPTCLIQVDNQDIVKATVLDLLTDV